MKTRRYTVPEMQPSKVERGDYIHDNLPWKWALLAFSVVEATAIIGGFIGAAIMNPEWIWGTGTFCAVVCGVLYLFPAIGLMLLTRFRLSAEKVKLCVTVVTIPLLILATWISYTLTIAMVGI